MPEDDKPKKSFSRGGLNLVLLGVGSIIIALALSSISLAIYHNSGDIYIDRSRPGFLFEDEENGTDAPIIEDYDFPKSGTITPEILDEYLKELEKEAAAIDAYEKPFGPDILSDEHLGITADSAE